MSFAELSNQIYAMPTGIEHVRSGYQLFMNNNEMTELPAGLDVERLGSLYKMCYGCTALTYVGELRTANITDLRWVFYGCSSLVNIPQRLPAQTLKEYCYCNMFSGCSGLTSLDLSNFNTSNVIKMSGMFQNCYNLKELNLKPNTFYRRVKEINV